MHLLIFKTDLESPSKINTIKPTFDNHQSIKNWNVDTNDIDNVLRIEAADNLFENDIIQILITAGFSCDLLPD